MAPLFLFRGVPDLRRCRGIMTDALSPVRKSHNAETRGTFFIVRAEAAFSSPSAIRRHTDFRPAAGYNPRENPLTPHSRRERAGVLRIPEGPVSFPSGNGWGIFRCNHGKLWRNDNGCCIRFQEQSRPVIFPYSPAAPLHDASAVPAGKI